MIQKLASIKITFFLLSVLVVCLLTGVVLTVDQHHASAMKSLSRQLPLKWLIHEARDDILLTVWFVGLCLIAGLFFIHVICCISIRIYRWLQNSISLRQWLFFLLHLMFVIVMLCHGLSMILGYKHSNIRLFEGQTFPFDDGYTLTLSDIRFVDDPAILKASYQDQRALMTRDNIHRHENYVRIALLKDNKVLLSGRIYILAPLRFGAFQITLTDFFIPENNTDDPIGVKLVISKNPVTPYFFGAYAVMIITLIGFIIMTWRNGITRNGQLTPVNVTKP